MIVSVALRTGVLGIGDYSDIVHLYRRDDLAGHPIPYLDYPLEYPVVTGAYVWVVSFVGWTDSTYFVASAAGLGALAVATVRMLERLPSTNPWLLAAAPAVAFWGVQNWDFLGDCAARLGRCCSTIGAGTQRARRCSPSPSGQSSFPWLCFRWCWRCASRRAAAGRPHSQRSSLSV